MLKVLLFLLVLLPGLKGDKVEVERIWGDNYSAFPSIVEFKGNYYVAFREGYSHVFDADGKASGKARILYSKDGRKWKEAALLEKEGFDLRDPKLSVTPDGRLMVIMGGSIYRDKDLKGMIPQVSFSLDGKDFSEPQTVYVNGDADDTWEWIWRLTWHEGAGYAITYGNHFALLKTLDGINYDIVKELDIDSSIFPNESTVRFGPDGKMYALVRCEGSRNGAKYEYSDACGRWGVSEYPYTEWKWKVLDFKVHGPDFIFLEDGSVVLGTRCFFPHYRCRTMIMSGDAEGNFTEKVMLPSGGDTSYPTLIDGDGAVGVVYYSSHEPNWKGEKKASIYLARIPKSLL